MASSCPRSRPAPLRFAMLSPPRVNNLAVFETKGRLRDSKGLFWDLETWHGIWGDDWAFPNVFSLG